MNHRLLLALLSCAIVLALCVPNPLAWGCCAVGPRHRPVLNADQSVIIIWDAANKMQHFIRQASFLSDADDFGFLVPTPTQPELAESGNEAFPYLQKLTVPPSPGGAGLGGRALGTDEVKVLERKLVAGFDATVLETQSASALVKWLKDNGYVFSAEVEAWVKPYLEQGWKITALKVAKDKEARQEKAVSASALRMTFRTDRPLFPYREPDDKQSVETLGAPSRLLRIYFLAEARYQGRLTEETPWTGYVASARKLEAHHRVEVLKLLKLPATTGPAEWWLTEFEDRWPYRLAPADVYFSPGVSQEPVTR